MRIGILAPMRQELAPVVRAMGLESAPFGDTTMKSGTVGQVEVVATSNGIGMAAATRATDQLLDAADVDHIMVVGVAGGVGPSVSVGDLIYPNVVVDKSTGAEHRPAHLGAPAARGTIVSSDDFTTDRDELSELVARGVIALDMETGAVATVCERRGCPWSVIRAISDMATDHQDDSVLGLAKPDGSANGPAVAKFLLTKPRRIPLLIRFARDYNVAATRAARAAARVCASA